MSQKSTHISADLLQVAEQLRAERPEASPLELDRIKLRATAHRSRSVARPGMLRSRVAVTGMLVAGLLMSSSGAALSLSATGGSAGVAQYAGPGETPLNTPAKDVPPTLAVPAALDTPSGDSLPATKEKGAQQGTQGVQAQRQVAAAATGKQLPFTGFAAIPLLIAGLALLVTGLVLRRRTAGDARR